MSKLEENCTNSSSGATTGNSSSSSESAEDIADLFRARVAALNVEDAAGSIRHPVASRVKSVHSTCHHNGHGKWGPYGRTHGFPICLKQANKFRLPAIPPFPHEFPAGRRSRPINPSAVIKDVWHDNLYEEFASIRKLVQKYKFVAMDTEFPGVVIWPDEDYRNSGEYQFEVIRTNVDALKLIQLGISFLDDNGIPPPGISTWQFNFRFNLKTDLNAQDSIDLLKDSGLQFDRLQSDGIDPDTFCELFMSSGLVLNSEVSWLTYHGGYDFGYLMRILLGKNLPSDGDEFAQLMKAFFPSCYDIKVMLADCGNIRGGLQDISNQLGLKRIGTQHQAGSDALLTGMTFFRIKQRYFGNSLQKEKYSGRIYGLCAPEMDALRGQQPQLVVVTSQ